MFLVRTFLFLKKNPHDHISARGDVWEAVKGVWVCYSSQCPRLGPVLIIGTERSQAYSS